MIGGSFGLCTQLTHAAAECRQLTTAHTHTPRLTLLSVARDFSLTVIFFFSAFSLLVSIAMDDPDGGAMTLAAIGELIQVVSNFYLGKPDKEELGAVGGERIAEQDLVVVVDPAHVPTEGDHLASLPDELVDPLLWVVRDGDRHGRLPLLRRRRVTQEVAYLLHGQLSIRDLAPVLKIGFVEGSHDRLCRLANLAYPAREVGETIKVYG